MKPEIRTGLHSYEKKTNVNEVLGENTVNSLVLIVLIFDASLI